MTKKHLIEYLKIYLRPTRLLSILRHYKQVKFHNGKSLILGINSSLSNCQIEDNIYIGTGCQIKNSTIGRRSYTNNYVAIQNAEIGRFVSIGSDVTIGVGAHPTSMVSTHPAFYSNNKIFNTYAKETVYIEFGKCIIGNDVWIGSKSTILNNIKIGDGAIIGYGAVVTKDIEPYSIVGGIPAKLIKYRFSPSIISRLLEIEWWKFNDDILVNNYNKFQDISSFIDFYDSNKDYLESLRTSHNE